MLTIQYLSYCSAIFPNFVFEVVQGSARVLNIKKTRKTRGGLISGGDLSPDEFFRFQVDGPITRGGLIRGNIS